MAVGSVGRNVCPSPHAGIGDAEEGGGVVVMARQDFMACAIAPVLEFAVPEVADRPAHEGDTTGDIGRERECTR